MTGWHKGRAHIEQLLANGDLDNVQPSGDLTGRLLGERARNKLFLAPGVLRAVEGQPEPGTHPQTTAT